MTPATSPASYRPDLDLDLLGTDPPCSASAMPDDYDAIAMLVIAAATWIATSSCYSGSVES